MPIQRSKYRFPIELYLNLKEQNKTAYLYYTREGSRLICTEAPYESPHEIPFEVILICEHVIRTYSIDKRFESIAALKREMKKGDVFYVFSQHPGNGGPWFHVSQYKRSPTKAGYRFVQNMGGHLHQKEAIGLYCGRPSLLKKEFVDYLSMQTFNKKDNE